MPSPRFLLIVTGIVLPFLCASALAQGQSEPQPPLDDFSDVQRELEGEGDPAPQPDNETQEDTQEDTQDEGIDEAVPQDETGADSILAGSQAALERIAKVIDRVDADAARNGNNWEMTIDDTQILVITDVNAGRMRIMTPIAAIKDLPEGAFLRLMQANFDSALDARYAAAQDLIWGTFIHPLRSLTERDFASGLLQTKTVADTFGTTFSSGAMVFGGGDSNAIVGDQLEDLLKELEKGDAI